MRNLFIGIACILSVEDQERDDIDYHGSNHLVLMFVAKSTNRCWSPLATKTMCDVFLELMLTITSCPGWLSTSRDVRSRMWSSIQDTTRGRTSCLSWWKSFAIFHHQPTKTINITNSTGTTLHCWKWKATSIALNDVSILHVFPQGTEIAQI